MSIQLNTFQITVSVLKVWELGVVSCATLPYNHIQLPPSLAAHSDFCLMFLQVQRCFKKVFIFLIYWFIQTQRENFWRLLITSTAMYYVHYGTI